MRKRKRRRWCRAMLAPNWKRLRALSSYPSPTRAASKPLTCPSGCAVIFASTATISSCSENNSRNSPSRAFSLLDIAPPPQYRQYSKRAARQAMTFKQQGELIRRSRAGARRPLSGKSGNPQASKIDGSVENDRRRHGPAYFSVPHNSSSPKRFAKVCSNFRSATVSYAR